MADKVINLQDKLRDNNIEDDDTLSPEKQAIFEQQLTVYQEQQRLEQARQMYNYIISLMTPEEQTIIENNKYIELEEIVLKSINKEIDKHMMDMYNDIKVLILKLFKEDIKNPLVKKEDRLCNKLYPINKDFYKDVKDTFYSLSDSLSNLLKNEELDSVVIYKLIEFIINTNIPDIVLLPDETKAKLVSIVDVDNIIQSVANGKLSKTVYDKFISDMEKNNQTSYIKSVKSILDFLFIGILD